MSKDKVTFATFCDMTSLHGWKFIPFRDYNKKSVVFWSLTILAALSSGGFIISNFANGKLESFMKLDISF